MLQHRMHILIDVNKAICGRIITYIGCMIMDIHPLREDPCMLINNRFEAISHGYAGDMRRPPLLPPPFLRIHRTIYLTLRFTSNGPAFGSLISLPGHTCKSSTENLGAYKSTCPIRHRYHGRIRTLNRS